MSKRIDWFQIRTDLGPVVAEHVIDLYRRLGNATEDQKFALASASKPLPMAVGQARRLLDTRWQAVWNLYCSLPGYPMTAYHGLVAEAISDRAPAHLVAALGEECRLALGGGAPT